METIKITRALADAARSIARNDEEDARERRQEGTTPHLELAVIVKARPGFMFGTFKESGSPNDYELVAMTLVEAQAYTAHVLSAAPIPSIAVATNPPAPAPFVCPGRNQKLIYSQKLAVCVPFDQAPNGVLLVEKGLDHHVREIWDPHKIIRLSTITASDHARIKLDSQTIKSKLGHWGLQAEIAGFETWLNERFPSSSSTHTIDIARILTSDIANRFFCILVQFFLNQELDIYSWTNSNPFSNLGHRMNPSQGKKKTVTGITLVVLIQRRYHSKYGVATAFSFAPSTVARQIREQRLGDLIGTSYTVKLLIAFSISCSKTMPPMPI